MKTALASSLMLIAPALAWAVPPDACTILTIEEINSIAGGSVEKVQPVKSGNPSECVFADGHRTAILQIKIREVQYAAADELHQERENDEKVYHTHAKDLKGIGEHAYWMPNVYRLGFHKGKTLVFVSFQRPKNQNEVDSAQLARMIEQRIK